MLLLKAHAPGQIPLDLNRLREVHVAAATNASLLHGRRAGPAAAAAAGCVGYTGNLHKWSYSPKGTGFLWASPEFQKIIIPPVLSGSAHNFLGSFAYTGTRDYAPFCSTGAGLDFRASLGTEADVIAYGHDLAMWAGEHLSKVWGKR